MEIVDKGLKDGVYNGFRFQIPEATTVAQKMQFKGKTLTIPNVLSLLRIALIPFIVWSCCGLRQYGVTAALLLLSAITDVADGFIARKFQMVSDLGKILDPIADKLTQTALLLCLAVRYRAMLAVLGLLVVKETLNAVAGLMVIRRTGNVYGAQWHGKLAAFLLYAAMTLHLLWIDIPLALSNALMILCILAMLLSLVIYGIRNIQLYKAGINARKP